MQPSGKSPWTGAYACPPACVREIAGQWFESASDGTRALHEEISPHEDVIEAAEVCPVKAIRVVNAADGTQVAP